MSKKNAATVTPAPAGASNKPLTKADCSNLLISALELTNRLQISGNQAELLADIKRKVTLVNNAIVTEANKEIDAGNKPTSES